MLKPNSNTIILKKYTHANVNILNDLDYWSLKVFLPRSIPLPTFEASQRQTASHLESDNDEAVRRLRESQTEKFNVLGVYMCWLLESFFMAISNWWTNQAWNTSSFDGLKWSAVPGEPGKRQKLDLTFTQQEQSIKRSTVSHLKINTLLFDDVTSLKAHSWFAEVFLRSFKNVNQGSTGKIEEDVEVGLLGIFWKKKKICDICLAMSISHWSKSKKKKTLHFWNYIH